MMVAAPGRFSTITGFGQRADSRSPRMRMITSAGPPAGNGTRMRTGPVGWAPGACARATLVTTAAKTRPVQTAFIILQTFISLGLDVGSLGDALPASNPLAHPGAELLRRIPQREDAEVADLVGELRG